MRWLKAAVAIMSILIVAMLVTIIVTIARRISADRTAVAASVAHPVLSDLTLPPGATMQSVTIADGHILVEVRDRDGADSLLLLDPATGKLTLSIAIHSAP